MIELSKENYSIIKPFLSQLKYETAYPFSILSGTQSGKLFVDQIDAPKSVLIWHYCGLSYVLGNSTSIQFNEELYFMMCHPENYHLHNMVIMVGKEDTGWNLTLQNLMNKNSAILQKERYFFTFDQDSFNQNEYIVPNGFTYFEIEGKHLPMIKGRVIPSYSWDSMEDFFVKGKGIGIYDLVNDKVVSTAITSGIDPINHKIDIGIETQPEYRKQGFATLAAAGMVNYVLSKHMEPDWGCDSQNIGSAHTAMHVGFKRTACCNSYRLLV